MAKTEKIEKNKAHPETKGLIFLSGFIVIALSLLSFSQSAPKENWLGLIGFGLAFAMNYLFGICSFLVAGYAGWFGWKLLSGTPAESLKYKHFAFGLLILSLGMLFNLFAELQVTLPDFIRNKVISESLCLDHPYPHIQKRYNLGGAPLYFLYRDLPKVNIQALLSDFGTSITFSITGILSFLLLSETKLAPFIEACIERFRQLVRSLKRKEKPFVEENDEEVSLDDVEKRLMAKTIPAPSYTKKVMKVITREELTSELEGIETSIKIPTSGSLTKKEKAIAAQNIVNGNFCGYQIPPASLLFNPKKVDAPSLKKDLKKQAEILEDTLRSFGIEAKVGDIHCGPTITSFEVHPAVGVKVQKIKALESDIALNLEAKSIRIIAPIPGKAAVGVEIPSLYPQEVSFKELLMAYQAGNSKKCHIPVLLGKSVNGENVVSDLAKMPHCIIAGATGSGKSVCINTIVMSILMTASPNEIKILMVDPKKVELTAYTKLPHLIAPVITEAHGAYAALNWLVKEMQNRYELLKQLGLRNIHAFNARTINKELEESLSQPIPEKMFSIVAIIDEFADLMMASSSDLETPIARIAQMARAVGIHLILATQRPSREVITGLIKANFPTRISFKVASRVNSQIILDDVGAESLLGNGDLLFLPPGSSQLMRAQGAYISDEEINRVIAFITDQAEAQYLIPSFDNMTEGLGLDGTLDEAKDSLYEEAYQIVVETKNASTTFLQRKLKIGYARAASLMDELEARGIIGPQEGSKPRRIISAKTESDFGD